MTVLVINLDTRRSAHLSFPAFRDCPVERFELQATDVLGPDVWLNGARLELTEDGTLPEIRGIQSESGIPVGTVQPLSNSFSVFRAA